MLNARSYIAHRLYVIYII